MYKQAPECLLEVIEAIEQANNRYKEVISELKEIDNLIRDIYHYLELEALDAVKMIKLTKKLKEVLLTKRKLINEKAMINAFRTDINSQHKIVDNHVMTTIRLVNSINGQGKRIENMFYNPKHSSLENLLE